MEIVKRSEELTTEGKAMVFAQQELERYTQEHPFPDELPMEARKHLMGVFKNQAAKNWQAGYDARVEEQKVGHDASVKN